MIRKLCTIVTKFCVFLFTENCALLFTDYSMLNQFPVDQMNAYPVSDLVDNPEINDIAMLKPIGEKLQADFEFPTRIIRPYRMHKEKTQTDVPWFNRVNGANKN